MALTDVSLGNSLAVRMQTDPAGVLDAPARPYAGIVIHVGAPVHIVCDRAGQRHAGRSVHGDVDVIPGFVPSRWELSEPDTAVILGLPVELLAHVAEVSGADAKRVEIVNRFQIRDSRVEHIGWAAKAEMEAGYPNGRLYLDGLATALAVHLLNRHASGARAVAPVKGAMPPRRLKEVLGYIEEHIAGPLSLAELARAAGIGVSQFSASFRVAMGQSAHQYVTRRRVERAEEMLRQPDSSISQVAMDTGFTHASHMAYQMRKILGISPTEAASRRPKLIAAVGFDRAAPALARRIVSEVQAMKKAAILAFVVLVLSAAFRGHAADDGAVPFPEGYRHWNFLHGSLISGKLPGFWPKPCEKPCTAGIFYFYANDKAMAGLKSGQYADGAIFAEELLEVLGREDGAGKEGARRTVGVMVKDENRYASTGGWGFGNFAGETMRDQLDGAARTACFQCHIPRKDKGYVFTEYKER